MLEYAEVVLTLTLIFAMVATSLNIPFGFGGVYNAAQGALFGVGAYAGALVAMNWTNSLLVSAVFAMLTAAAAGLVLILPAARARHEYFMITSLGLQIVASTYFVSAELIGGNDGLVGIPQAELFGWIFKSRMDYLLLALVGLLVAMAVAHKFRHSPAGRALTAVGCSEEAARSLGIDPLHQRAMGLLISAALAGLAGSIYSFAVGFINPETFGLNTSILVFTMVILGGAGTMTGPLIGALILTIVPAALTFVDIVPAGQAGALQQTVFGTLLVIMVIFRPEGLVGHRKRRASDRTTLTADLIGSFPAGVFRAGKRTVD
jgi:branched-chain amino acid transport system permease protein